MTLGAALLTPFLPSRLAGIGLGIFSGSLFTMYLRTPGMTLEDGLRPSPQGTALAKDIWMLGIAAALVLDRKPKPGDVSCQPAVILDHRLTRP
jgi:hypothetical protein